MAKKKFDSIVPCGYLYPMILRKLGSPSQAARCAGGHNCPAVFELTSGDFAIVGADITDEAAAGLPTDSGCGPGERIVRIPRHTLVLARADIPAAL